MKIIEYEPQPGKVIFGQGALSKVADALESVGGKRAAIISTDGRKDLANKVAALLGPLCQTVYTKSVQHVPVETVDEALTTIESLDIDSLVAVGGGSPIGLAKAIALKTSLPIIAIPTTYSGSEMTPIWGMTKDGIKTTGRDIAVKPKVVIFDPELTLSLSSRLSITSGINALAHCAEGLYSENANPVTLVMAEKGFKEIIEGLTLILEDSKNIEGRSKVLLGAWMGGGVLGTVSLALHHKICHALGGSYNLPHADTHTAILPYALWYNLGHVPEARDVMARILDVEPEDVPGAVYDLIAQFGGPTSVKEVGMKEENLREAASIIVQNPYYNPRPVEEESIYKLLEYAYKGDRPIAGVEI